VVWYQEEEVRWSYRWGGVEVTEPIITRFPIVNDGGYYIDFGRSIVDVFGFKFPKGNNILCLKRDDKNDCYVYRFFGYALRAMVRMTRVRGSSYFSFPKGVYNRFVFPKNASRMYVRYNDDGSVVMSVDDDTDHDFVENIIIGKNILVSNSFDTYMTDLFYTVVLLDKSMVLIPVGSAMWSFMKYTSSGRHRFLVENVYDFVVRKDVLGEFSLVRICGDHPQEFEVLNSVGYKA
jgi:hypothetical protein